VAGSAVAIACGSEAIRQEGVEADWGVGVRGLLSGALLNASALDEGVGATCSNQGVMTCQLVRSETLAPLAGVMPMPGSTARNGKAEAVVAVHDDFLPRGLASSKIPYQRSCVCLV
jgi:hypothetical protein